MSQEKVSILIVEDDPIIGLDLKGSLETSGYSVSGPITSGEEVLERISDLVPDLVLMDINLKGKLDGIETVKALHMKHDVPCIFLTANSDEKTLQRAMLTGPYGYLIKPFDPFELHSSIKVALLRAKTQDVSDEDDGNDIEFDSNDQLLYFLRNVPALKAVPTEVLQELSSKGTVRTLEANETLVSPENENPSGFIPLSGRISITKASRAGKELVVALVGMNDVFGLFYGLEPFQGTSWAQTQVPSKVVSFPGTLLKKLLNDNLQLLAAINTSVAQRLVHSHELSTSLAHSGVEDRITSMILALLQDFGKESNKGSDSGRIFITRRELADLVGTTPETAIRITKNLEREGLLDLTKPGIIKVPAISKLVEWTEAKE